MIRCEVYRCTLSEESCAKRHRAAIDSRTSDWVGIAFPSCRRCPIGAANAKTTDAPSVIMERGILSKHVRLAANEHCAMPGCHNHTASQHGLKKLQALAPFCGECRNQIGARQRHHKLSLAEAIERQRAIRAGTLNPKRGPKPREVQP